MLVYTLPSTIISGVESVCIYTFLHGCVLMCAREREREREREGVCYVSAGIYITEYHYFWCRKCMYIQCVC